MTLLHIWSSRKTWNFIRILTWVVLFIILFLTISFSFIFPFNLILRGLYVVFGVLVVLKLAKEKVVYLPGYLIILVTFFCIAVASGIVNLNFSIHLFTLATLIPTCYLLYCFLKIENNIALFTYLYFATFVLFIITFSIIYFEDILALSNVRIGDYFSDQNILGYNFLFGICFNIYIIFKNRKMWPIVIFIPYTILLIFLSGSRSALVFSLLILIFTLFFYVGKKQWYISLGITIGIVSLLVFLLMTPSFESLKNRFIDMIMTFFGQSADVSSDIRFMVIDKGVSLIIMRPFLGYGNDILFIKYCIGNYAHNNFIQVAFNFGIPAMILFQILLIYLLYKIHKSLDLDTKTKGLFYTLFLLIFIIQTSYPNYSNKIEYIVFAAAAGSVDCKYIKEKWGAKIYYDKAFRSGK